MTSTVIILSYVLQITNTFSFAACHIITVFGAFAYIQGYTVHFSLRNKFSTIDDGSRWHLSAMPSAFLVPLFDMSRLGPHASWLEAQASW